MLSFLDSLCGALIARDVLRIRQLLAHPLSRALPRAVRDEAAAIAAGGREAVAPLQAMRFYHQTAHLLGVRLDPAARGRRSRDAAYRQMDLPLEVLASS